MNIREMLDYLKKIGDISYLYSVNSLGNGECVCITYDWEPDEGWAVGYSERGKRYDVERFASESDACRHLIKRVIDIAREEDLEIDESKLL